MGLDRRLVKHEEDAAGPKMAKRLDAMLDRGRPLSDRGAPLGEADSVASDAAEHG